MSGPKHDLTPAEYLFRERSASSKSEYYRGETSAMAGASKEHVRIRDNLARVTGNHLLDGPCEVFSSDLRVKADATGLYTYPDMVIVCGEPIFEDADVDTLLNPRVIVEVLSESAQVYDRGIKFGHYKTIPSFEEYILVAQDRPLVERHFKHDGVWTVTTFAGLSEDFSYRTIPVVVPLSEIYRRVMFPDSDAS